MKKYLLPLLLALSFALLGCGNSTETANKPEKEEENEQVEPANDEVTNDEEDEETADKEEDAEAEVGETIENEGGSFTLIHRKEDINTIETGPVIMEVEQVVLASGKLKGEAARILEQEDIEYIQLDLVVENTSDEDLMFYPGHATMATSTGEQLDNNYFLSDNIDGTLLAGVTVEGSIYYVLEKSKAEEIDSIRLIWDAPSTTEYEDIGEKADITIDID